jgi:hypothetical protein
MVGPLASIKQTHIYSKHKSWCRQDFTVLHFVIMLYTNDMQGRRGRDVVGFTTTCAISAHHH